MRLSSARSVRAIQMAAYRVVFRRQDSFKHSLGFFSHGRGEVFRYKTPQKPLQEKARNEITETDLKPELGLALGNGWELGVGGIL
jgi:hypothetical protein